MNDWAFHKESLQNFQFLGNAPFSPFIVAVQCLSRQLSFPEESKRDSQVDMSRGHSLRWAACHAAGPCWDNARQHMPWPHCAEAKSRCVSSGLSVEPSRIQSDPLRIFFFGPGALWIWGIHKNNQEYMFNTYSGQNVDFPWHDTSAHTYTHMVQ